MCPVLGARQRALIFAVCGGVWLLPIACRYGKCNLILHCACWQCVESLCLPLSCCCKNVFREKGVRVDTVAVSLFLASIWNFLVGGGRGVIGEQRLRKRELLPLGKKRPHWLQLLCGTGEPQPPLLPWMSHLAHQEHATLQCCLTGTCPCFFISQTQPASRDELTHKRDSFTCINLFSKHSPEFPTCPFLTLSSPLCSSRVYDSSSLGSAEQGDIRGCYHGNEVAGKCLYGVRARQCYRLFCSKQ